MQIALASVVGLLCVLAVAAYAIDRAYDGKISEGIRIGGVDVGGMTEEQAERRLHARLVEPLDKPVTVTYEKTKYVLSPEKLQVRADIQGMVNAALRASRSGDFPSRVWRYATGGTVDREIAPHIAYSADALDEFVGKVEQEVNRPAQDASINPTPASLNTVPAEDGVALDTGQLRSELRAAIESPNNRVVKAPAERVQPEVTTDELASEYPVYLTVDRGSFQLHLWENLKLTKTYTIAVGAAGFDTPAGVYSIDSKQVDPTWYVPDAAWAGDLAGTTVPPGPDNPLQARWMGFFDGAGIHGTSDVASLGTAASHGCLRMAVPEVIELYDQVPLGTPIYIG